MIESIILVGANGSGKSTLGLKLSEVLDLPYHHAGPSPGGCVKAFSNCMEQVSLIKKRVILDRATPICERVYNESLDCEEAFFLKLFTDYMSDKAVFVLCVGQGELTHKNYYPPGHFDEISRSQDKIRNKYIEIMKNVPHVVYNWETDSFDNLLEEIRNAKL